MEELEARIQALMARFEQHGVTVSRKKFNMGSTISFGGYLITADGEGVKIKPDPARIQELLDIKPPTNITELRSFLGSMKQLSNGCQGCQAR